MNEQHPWENEQDSLVWIDIVAGYDCMMLRHSEWLFWRGYVGLTSEHSLYNIHYDDIDDVDFEVHGGLTFSGRLDDLDGGSESGVGDDAWWFGFDCAHYTDFLPGGPGSLSVAEDCYRDQSYVKSQVNKLAEQLFQHK